MADRVFSVLLLASILVMSGCLGGGPAGETDAAALKIPEPTAEEIDNATATTVAPPPPVIAGEDCYILAMLAPVPRSEAEPFLPANFEALPFASTLAADVPDDGQSTAVLVGAGTCAAATVNNTAVAEWHFAWSALAVTPPAEYRFDDENQPGYFLSLGPAVVTDAASEALVSSWGIATEEGTITHSEISAGAGVVADAFEWQAAGAAGRIEITQAPGVTLYSGALHHTYFTAAEGVLTGAFNATLPPWGLQLEGAMATYRDGLPLGHDRLAGVGVRAVGSPLDVGMEQAHFADGPIAAAES